MPYFNKNKNTTFFCLMLLKLLDKQRSKSPVPEEYLSSFSYKYVLTITRNCTCWVYLTELSLFLHRGEMRENKNSIASAIFALLFFRLWILSLSPDSPVNKEQQQGKRSPIEIKQWAFKWDFHSFRNSWTKSKLPEEK